MWRRRRGSMSAALVAECEAFLAGGYAEQLDELDPAPDWVWLNLLAHGTLEQLVAAQRELGSVRARAGDWRARRWRDARAYLAGEVLDVVRGQPDRLGALQERVLIPLELRLAATSPARLSPGHVVSAVVRALEDDAWHQRRRRDPATPRPPAGP